MSWLSKAWSPPPSPVSGPSLVTQSMVSTISAQAFRMATTPRYVHVPFQKNKPVEFVPRIFLPVTLHGVVVHFNPDELARLRTRREEVQKNIRRALGSGRRAIHGVAIRDIVAGLSRSTLHTLRGRVDSLYDERNKDADVEELTLNRAYNIRTYRPCDSLHETTIFETLVFTRQEKKFQNGVIRVVPTLTDPSLPCAWPGTTEFGEKARAATFRLSGQGCSLPCYSCSCVGRSFSGPL